MNNVFLFKHYCPQEVLQPCSNVVKLACNLQHKYNFILQRCGYVALQHCHFYAVATLLACLFHNIEKKIFLQLCITLYLRCVVAGMEAKDMVKWVNLKYDM